MADKLTTKQRTARAVALRASGRTYDQIADALGLKNRSSAYRIVQRALDSAIREPAKEVLRIELARLDQLQTAVWVDALQGKGGAVDRALRIMDRRARYLGLDVAEQETPPALDAIAQQLAQLRADDLNEPDAE